MVNWMKSRMKERTSWDGAVCVALGLMIHSWHHSLRLRQDLQSHGVYGQFGNLNDYLRGSVRNVDIPVTVTHHPVLNV